MEYFLLALQRQIEYQNANYVPSNNDADLKKAERGYSTEYVGSAYGVEMNTVLWKDTKNVRLCSTYVGIKPFLKANASNQPTKVLRYNLKEKEIY